MMNPCKWCGSPAKVMYCSRTCYQASQKGKFTPAMQKAVAAAAAMGGPNRGKKLGRSPHYARIEMACETCGASFIVQRARKDTARFCSRACKYIGSRGPEYNTTKAIRKSLTYRAWRAAVFERDDYTCKTCGARGGVLNADHIKPFSVFPELRFDVSNGRTLCVDCHRQTDTWGTKALRFKAA